MRSDYHDTAQTLEVLEKDVWGEPDCESHLVVTCHRLRKKPINQFSVEDLRIMIGQNIGLDYLVPLAMHILRENPLAAGDFYDGDLLKVVISCDFVLRADNEKLVAELVTVCEKAMIELEAAESADLSWETSPENFGLTHEDAEQSIRSKIEKLRSSKPYRDFAEFCEAA